MQIKKIKPKAIIPSRADKGAAGYDLSSIEDYILPPNTRELISTGLSMAITPGFYGHISDRSGMAWKTGAHCLGKIIDETYRGEIKIIILNTDNQKTLHIKSGDRIAQIIFHKYETPELVEVDELDDTERGEKGFGSSGT